MPLKSYLCGQAVSGQGATMVHEACGPRSSLQGLTNRSDTTQTTRSYRTNADYPVSELPVAMRYRYSKNLLNVLLNSCRLNAYFISRYAAVGTKKVL